MKRIHLHPLTVVTFIVCLFFEKGKFYFTLYLFIFLHELSHMAVSFLLGYKASSIHLFPWGCVLTLKEIPSASKSIPILSAGCAFNLIMFAFGIFPKENLTLALFNLIPVMPLDGGVLINLLLPGAAFFISLAFIAVLFIFTFYMHLPPTLPLFLLLTLFLGEKNRMKKNIDIMVLRHFQQK